MAVQSDRPSLLLGMPKKLSQGSIQIQTESAGQGELTREPKNVAQQARQQRDGLTCESVPDLSVDFPEQGKERFVRTVWPPNLH